MDNACSMLSAHVMTTELACSIHTHTVDSGQARNTQFLIGAHSFPIVNGDITTY